MLLRNDGNGRFTDVTAELGSADAAGARARRSSMPTATAISISSSCATSTGARSGELPCFSLTGAPDYCSPRNYDAPLSDILYRNNGDGTFTDVSESAGLHTAFGNGLGVVVTDATIVMAVRTCSSPTMRCRISCGSIAARPRFENEALAPRHRGRRRRLGEVGHGGRREGSRTTTATRMCWW